MFLLDAYWTNNVLWNYFNFKLKKTIQNEDRLVKLMSSVLVSYVEDGGIEPWLKPRKIKCVFVVQNYEISARTFQTCLSFIYGSDISFFLYVCLSVRVCVCL